LGIFLCKIKTSFQPRQQEFLVRAIDIDYFFLMSLDIEKRIPLILELGFRQDALPGLEAYLELLWSTNEELNLISRKMTPQELIDNHLIDCLLPLKKFPTTSHEVADFGAGGGLPGVVYALQFPQVKYHLFEKSPKKQAFLKNCKAIAPNIEVHGEISQDLGDVGLVTVRAFKPIDVILDVSRKYGQKSGKYFLLKGRREKIDEELELAYRKFKNILRPENVQIEKLSSPVLDVERHLVLLNFPSRTS
jgi:16S rRNA (guanine527-N7)-methyltransferase